jgi:hypothetical protein
MPGEDTEDQEQDPPASSEDTPAAGLAALLARHKNDSMSMATQLYDENYQLRKRVKRLRQEATSGAVPEGAVVLTGDALTAYNAYRALGSVEEVQSRLEDVRKLEADVAAAKRRDTMAKAAKVANFKLSALEPLAGGLTFEVVEEGTGEQKKEVAYVKDGDNRVLLEKFAEDKWPDLVTALRDTGTSNGNGTQWPRQNSEGRSGPVDVVGQHLESTYVLPSKRGTK